MQIVQGGIAPLLLAASVAVALTACDDPGGDPSTGPRGPDGGELTFDASMISWDLSVADGGPVDLGRDLGPPDLGPPDLGPPDLGPPTYVCRGVASSCLSQGTLSSCLDVTGCSWDGECTGSARSCYSQFSSYSCIRQDGCYWGSSSMSCSGSARSCYGYAGSASCAGQSGCSWRSECEGYSSSCSSFYSSTSCTGQPGCRWEVQ